MKFKQSILQDMDRLIQHLTVDVQSSNIKYKKHIYNHFKNHPKYKFELDELLSTILSLEFNTQDFDKDIANKLCEICEAGIELNFKVSKEIDSSIKVEDLNILKVFTSIKFSV